MRFPHTEIPQSSKSMVLVRLLDDSFQRLFLSFLYKTRPFFSFKSFTVGKKKGTMKWLFKSYQKQSLHLTEVQFPFPWLAFGCSRWYYIQKHVICARAGEGLVGHPQETVEMDFMFCNLIISLSLINIFFLDKEVSKNILSVLVHLYKVFI